MQVNRTNSTSFGITLIPRNLTNAQRAVVAGIRRMPGDRTSEECSHLLRFVDRRVEEAARVVLGRGDIPYVPIEDAVFDNPQITNFVDSLEIAYFPHKLNI